MDTANVPPVIRDQYAAARFLENLPLSNPHLADQKLGQALDGLIADPPDVATLFIILEQLRTPLSFVEEERAKLYHNKPLLLSDEQEACFEEVLAVWQRMSQAYALCARLLPAAPEDPQFATRIATILHRCLYYTGMYILEHFRARREIPLGVWHELHGYYETAEQWGVSHTPVNDALESDVQATHCTAAFVTVLLIEVSNPYGNSLHDLDLIRRWAGMWAPLVALHPLADEHEVPPYIIELNSDQPLHSSGGVDKIGSDARCLDTSRLGLQLSHMLAQLHQRLTPAQLGLGGETPGHVTKLLERLSRPWTQTASPRKFRRFPTAGKAKVALGYDAMHFYVGGRDFIQSDTATAYSRGEFDELFTFRERVAPGLPLSIKEHAQFPLDEWAVINQSATGFRLARSVAGQKLSYGQLLAICPHDGDAFLLGQVSWLMQDSIGDLAAGVSLLPGVPESIGVRPSPASPGQDQRFARGFLLPALAAIDQEASIVIPVNMYRASGLLEVIDGNPPWHLRMVHVLQRGLDFDRVSFEKL